MNICHVITRLIIGGAQENTILTCRGLAEKGHKVTLIAGPETGPEGSLWDQAERAGCELIAVNSLRRAVNPWHDWRAYGEITRIFRRLAPDVIHTHSSKAGILGRFAAARSGGPVIIHTIHGMSFNRTQSVPTRMVYRRLERLAARRTTAFITVADAMLRQAVTAGLAARERFTTIRSGMETDRFRPDLELRGKYRRQWGVGSDEVVVGTICRLFDNKGYEETMDAMPQAIARAPNVSFVWIGEGANRRAYENRLLELGLRDKVRLLGLMTPQGVAEALNGFDMLLHASRWEGLPRAVVQALLTEVPAISFDNDGAPEVVIPGETGILVPYGDTNQLAQAVVTLARDTPLRRRLGRQGRIRCVREFDWRLMVDAIERLYVSQQPSRT